MGYWSEGYAVIWASAWSLWTTEGNIKFSRGPAHWTEVALSPFMNGGGVGSMYEGTAADGQTAVESLTRRSVFDATKGHAGVPRREVMLCVLTKKWKTFHVIKPHVIEIDGE